MELKPGYKQTEAGIIPEDWNDFTVEELKSSKENALSTGPFGSSIGSRFFRDSGVPIIRGGNLSGDSRIRLDDNGLVFLSKSKAAEFARSAVRQGDLVFTCWGTINQIGLIDDQAKYAEYIISNKQMKLTPDLKKTSSLFLYYLFSSSIIQAKLTQNSIGSSIPGFNLGQLRSMRLTVPPLSEQRAIAGALSDTDALLSNLDRLLAKKRDIKQAVMQQILTGKQRLPGFRGEGVDRLLGDLGTFKKGKGIKKDDVVSDGVPCIRYGEIYTRHHIHIKRFHSYIPRSVADRSQRLKKGDLLFAGSGETSEDIGKCVSFLGDEEVYAGGDIVIFSPVGQDSLYLGYLMNQPYINAQKSRKGQGDAVVHISAGSLAQLQVSLPSLNEQTAIAAVLSDMDAEIDALQQRRDKTRAIKQGMMQELLTGRTRLL